MFTRKMSIHIEASPDEVFEYISDVSHNSEWARDQIEFLGPTGVRAKEGSSFGFKVHFGIMGSWGSKLTVLSVEPPRRFVYECRETLPNKDSGVGAIYRWTFEVAPEGRGTRLTHSFIREKDMALVVAVQPMAWLVLGRKVVGGGLRKIRANVEAKVAASAAEAMASA